MLAPISPRRPGNQRHLALSLAALMLVATVSACSSDADSTDEGDGSSTTATSEPTDVASDPSLIFPGDTWERAEAEAEGFDPAVLEEIAAEAAAQHSNCLVVTRRGRVVADWYWNDTDARTAQEVFSVTKSFASTLVGIAVDRDELDLDEPAATFIQDWAGTPAESVTVRNLVSNDSGRYWDFQRDFFELPASPDATGFAIDLPQTHAPGVEWVYNNSAIQTLDEVLLEATGTEPTAYADEYLLDPIGMSDSEMVTDASGNTLMYMGLASTCEDLARFGYLFLRDGRWNDHQVISSEWVQEATRPSQDLNTGYGFLWWLNTPAGPDDTRDQMAPEADPQMYAAQGLFGQTVLVDPATEVVVTRMGTSDGDLGNPWGSTEAARIITEALADAG